jgi:phosphoribosylformylglycinamidine synthase
LSEKEIGSFLEMVHDRMTECRYDHPLDNFETGLIPEKPFEVPVLEKGRKALEDINQDMGLAFDDWDLDYYTRLFKEDIGRNPTNVECFDIAQSNSEHSRHWFFKGKLIIDGEEIPSHLIALDTTTGGKPKQQYHRFQGQLECDQGIRNTNHLAGRAWKTDSFSRSPTDL